MPPCCSEGSETTDRVPGGEEARFCHPEERSDEGSGGILRIPETVLPLRGCHAITSFRTTNRDSVVLKGAQRRIASPEGRISGVILRFQKQVLPLRDATRSLRSGRQTGIVSSRASEATRDLALDFVLPKDQDSPPPGMPLRFAWVLRERDRP